MRAGTDRGDGLAAYAADPMEPGPRAVHEPPAAGRTAFQRDRDRLVHSTAFRRLAQKTQVLVPQEGELHRTRLTHTLEVAQIARSLARALRLDEDLAEALALAHDFGHGPFGHTGEEGLDAALQAHGGFDHNVQSLRIVVDLERRYLDFDGLNLTWTTLEGLAKRKGPCPAPAPLLLGYAARLGLDLGSFPSAEAQVAALADDIAYNAHDLDDGLQAGFFMLEEAAEVPILAALRESLMRDRPDAAAERLPFAMARGLIDLFVTDALAESTRRLEAAAPADVAAVRRLDHAAIGLSPALAGADAEIKRFLSARMYLHPRLIALRRRAKWLVGEVTGALLADPGRLPAPWAEQAATAEAAPRIVGDYVAGLTDRQAVAAYRRLFDASFEFV